MKPEIGIVWNKRLHAAQPMRQRGCVFYVEIIFKQQLELELIFILSVMCVMDAEAELKSASVRLRFLPACAVAPGDESQFDLNDNLMLSLKSFSNCQECVPSAQGQIIFPKQGFIYLFAL